MTLTPSVRAISLCSLPFLANSAASPSFAAMSVFERLPLFGSITNLLEQTNATPQAVPCERKPWPRPAFDDAMRLAQRPFASRSLADALSRSDAVPSDDAGRRPQSRAARSDWEGRIVRVNCKCQLYGIVNRVRPPSGANRATSAAQGDTLEAQTGVQPTTNGSRASR
jgi:hypothetical protein